MTFSFGGWSGSSYDSQTVDNPTYYVDAYGKFGVLDIDTGARQVIRTGFDKLMDIAGTPSGALYGVSNGKLYSIDPSNGNLAVIGATPSFTGFGASDDALYGVTGNKIYTVNPQTGASAFLATLNGYVAGDLVVVDNALYISTTHDQLVKYDLATGQQSVLVNNLPGASTYGIAVDSNGDIVGVNTSDQGYRVDVDTGAVTLAANVSGPTINDMAGINSPVDPVDPVTPPAQSIVVDGENFSEVMNPGYNDANAPTNGGGDIIDGADGNDDIILGNGGDDTINAGLGEDLVSGGSGDDVIDGGQGNDLIFGDINNSIVGDRGNDGAPTTLDFSDLYGGRLVSEDGSIAAAVQLNGFSNITSSYTAGKATPEGGLFSGEHSGQYSANFTFDNLVSDVNFTLYDINQGGSWDDQVRIIALDVNGNQVPVNFSGTNVATGGVDVGNNTVDGNNNNTTYRLDSANPDNVQVSIQGPIASLQVIHEPGNDTSSTTGWMGISDINATAFNNVVGIVDNGTNGSLIGDDIIDGGIGNDIIYGDNGEDLATGGNNFTGPRESFNWDLLSQTQADSSVVQDTGDVKVTYSRIADTGHHDSQINNSINLNTAGIDSGFETIDTNSSLESVTNGIGNEGAFQWEFDEPVGNVEFNINDLDGDGIVAITAYGPNGVTTIPVDLVGGSDIVINGNTATAVGPYQDDNDPDTTVQVTIQGPVTRIVLEHEQVGSDNSGIHITDMYFDTGFVPGTDSTNGIGGDDIITGGDGADTMFGEGGNDTFIVASETEGAGDVIVGGNGPDQNTDYDVLDLRGAGPVTIDDAADQNDVGARAGTVTFENGSTLEFSQIEEILQDTAPTKITITPAPGTQIDDEGRPVTTENGTPAQIVVSLDAPALEDTVITLTDVDPSETDAPTTVTILAGQTSVLVDVPSVDDPIVDGTQIAPITATAPGLIPDTIDVAVQDDDEPTLIIDPAPSATVDVNGNPVTEENGQPTGIVITRTGPLDEPLEVTLTSDDTTEATVPASVTIPAGQDSIFVPISPVDDPIVDGDQVPTITATAPGFAPVEQDVVVKDDDEPTLIIEPAPGATVDVNGNPVTEENGQPTGIVITRTGPLDEPLEVTLTSDDTTEATVPASVTIPAGQDSIFVPISPVDDPIVDGDQVPTITATAPGFAPVEQDVVVKDDDGVVNQGPDAVDDDIAQSPVSTPVVISPAELLANDSDPEGDDFTPVSIQDPVNGTVEFVGGNVVFTPTPGYEGPASFTYTIEEVGTGKQDTATVNLIFGNDPVLTIEAAPGTPVDENGNPVTQENGDPVEVVITRTGPLDEPLVVTLGSDDPTEGTVQPTVTIPAGQASVTVPVTPVDDPIVDGDQTPVITATAPGFDPVEQPVVVEDDDVPATPELTIEAAPGTPVDENGNPVTQENGDPVEVVITRTGPLDEPLVVTLGSDDPTEGTVQPTVTIPAGQASVTVPVTPVDDPIVDGDQTPVITATAPGFDPVEQPVVVEDDDTANQNPVALDDNLGDFEAGQPATIDIAQILSNDTDPDGDQLTPDAVISQTNGQFQFIDGVPSFVPDAGFTGIATLEYRVSDGNGGSDTAVITFNFVESNPNQNPVANDDDLGEFFVNTPATINIATILANDSDPDGDTIRPDAVISQTNGQFQFINGVPSFVPDAGFTGVATLEYRVTDDNGGFDTAVITFNFVEPAITIEPAPTATVDADGNPVTIENGDDVPVVITRNGPLDEPLTVTLGTDDPTEITGPQTVTIPAGQASVTIPLSPVDDTEVDGPQTPTITVSAPGFPDDSLTAVVKDDDVVANEPPVANPDTISGVENTPIKTTVAELLANDTDPDGDTPALVTVQNAENGSVALDPNGIVYFIPDTDFVGEAKYDYTITDGNGGESTTTVTVNVTPENGEPVAKGDSVNGLENSPIVTPVAELLANDVDPDGDTLTVVDVTDPENGTVELVNGNVIFTPTPGYTGPASYVYTVSDGKGGVDTATVQVTVAQPNQGPVATDDTIDPSVAGEEVVISIAELLSNDFDPDGDAVSPVGLVGTPENGTARIEGGNVIFTPTPGYDGPASFDYQITDGNGGFDTATVNLQIAKANLAPVAQNDAAEGTQDAPVLTSIAALLANDSDPDGDQLTITSVQDAQNGSVALDTENGTVVFIPTEGYKGPASYTYTVSDGQGGVATATVNLTIAELNEAPIANDDLVPGATTAGVPLVIATSEVLDNDTDPNPNDVLTVTEVGNPVNGTVTLNGTNITFTPDAGHCGPASFSYVVTDTAGLTSTATVNLVIGDTLIVGDNTNNELVGTAGSDVMNGLEGNDRVLGLDGDDCLQGGKGDDWIEGGAGNDEILGGRGNDFLDGGNGQLTALTSGADTFIWKYDDIKDEGNGREIDFVKNFGNDDVLNLADLLQGEQNPNLSQFDNQVLDAYLNFEYDANLPEGIGGTVVSVSALGSFNFAETDQKGDQQIVLEELDITAGNTLSDIEIITNLLANNQLVTDLG